MLSSNSSPSSLWTSRVPHPISKAEPRHPRGETHFGCLYLQSLGVGTYCRAAGISKALPSNSVLVSSQQSGTIANINADAVPIHLSNSCSISCEQDPKIFQLLCLGQQLIPNPKGAIHCFLAENHGFRPQAPVCAKCHHQWQEPFLKKQIIYSIQDLCLQ